jgi:hypothetical protein
MTRGGIAAYVDVLEAAPPAPRAEEDEPTEADDIHARLYRAALWGITTWLSSTTLQKRAEFIRQRGLAVLLEASERSIMDRA